MPTNNHLSSADTHRDSHNSHSNMSSNQTQIISVDNVLGFTSEIPSGQPRGPPPVSPITPTRIPPDLRAKRIKAPPSAKLPAIQTRINQRVPQRSTKTVEKLVLLPDDDESGPSSANPSPKYGDNHPALAGRRPLRDDEWNQLKQGGSINGHSYAEFLPKRDRSDTVARLTAYCGAQGYNVTAAAKFLRETHGAKAKLYDDCLYIIYALPLLPGSRGFRVRSRPILKTPGSTRTVIDEQIERSEQRVDHSQFLGFQGDGAPDEGVAGSTMGARSDESTTFRVDADEPNLSTLSRLPPTTNMFAEMFIFTYGVAVFWNFTEQQERLILADLEFADQEDEASETSDSASNADGNSEENEDDNLVQTPLNQNDFETEEFHFAYSADVSRPRIFNDMITLLPGSDHMIKLTISHAIAQSTKLCYFEGRMTQTLNAAQDIPRRLAKSGKLRMTREQIMSIMGYLFKSRVELNLSSNILDTPKFFWDSEPTLHPLYEGIREYLELENRIKVLNERCQVFLDLTEILSDSIADNNMSYITWIIIILILISIGVTCSEVVIRFALLSRSKERNKTPSIAPPPNTLTALQGISKEDQGLVMLLAEDLVKMNVSVEDLKLWSMMWTPEQKGAVCGASVIPHTFGDTEL